METATENGLNAPKYLEWLLDTMAQADSTESMLLDQWMPWSSLVPEYCRMSSKGN